MKFTVRGDDWILRHTSRLKKAWGVCDTALRTITLYSKMRPKKLLEVTLHEFAHAYFQDADESVIKQFGVEASEYLWKLGYRKGDH